MNWIILRISQIKAIAVEYDADVVKKVRLCGVLCVVGSLN